MKRKNRGRDGVCLVGLMTLLLTGWGSEEALPGTMILGPESSEVTYTNEQKTGPDTMVTASVTASVGVASKTWQLTIISKGGAKANGCVPAI
ncbi:MAG: hypothetical protein LLH30_19160 [Candidatus Manganitrophus sp. SA1]|nr:hypothetical protein [Candidatus Manganitrophus morganii]